MSFFVCLFQPLISLHYIFRCLRKTTTTPVVAYPLLFVAKRRKKHTCNKIENKNKNKSCVLPNVLKGG
jgi:hypothetical protein